MGELPIVGGVVKMEILQQRHNNNQLGGSNGGKAISEVRKQAKWPISMTCETSMVGLVEWEY